MQRVLAAVGGLEGKGLEFDRELVVLFLCVLEAIERTLEGVARRDLIGSTAFFLVIDATAAK